MRCVGVDIGGTFTDLIYVDGTRGAVLVHKLPTTPDDPARATVQGIVDLTEKAGVAPADVEQVFHGTTIATNIVIEHNGANVGMITTAGYRDILHIARHKKPLNFSNHQELPWQRYPLVLRRHRLTVPERITATGEVLVPLDEEAVRARARELRDAGVDAVAICFLFSFLNDAHERRAAEIVREEMPGVYLSVSSEVLPQYREYERFSTVALNAFVGPKVAGYVARIADELRELGVETELHLMTSSSGVATASAAVERPVSLLMSGPVAGVVGGVWVGRQSGYDSVITLDVGGTSADVGVVQSGVLRMKHLLETRVGPYQAMVPMVDVDTIGAGGGSIAYMDDGGMFRCGPRSAGAVPGPAAYGRGGSEPTVTDAMVNLGWLPPDGFVEKGMTLDAAAARSAFEPLADRLGLSVEEASLGAVHIASQLMVQAIEENSVRKGFDPRDFALVAAGGAGPLFAAEVAREVGTDVTVVPRFPGVTAALGLLATDVVYEYATTVHQSLQGLDGEGLARAFERMRERGRAQLAADQVPASRQRFEMLADCRYAGQGYELRVPCPEGPIDSVWAERLADAFHQAHEREYSRSFEGTAIELPTIRLRGIGAMPPLAMPRIAAGGESAEHARCGAREVWFAAGGALQLVEAAVYARESLVAGNRVDGPGIVTQYDTTTVLPPDFCAEVDSVGNLLITRAAPERGGLPSKHGERVRDVRA
jgi:N-methylhydantoinase A/oxoprolinase/acetone carboxylase beta subunit